MKLIKYIKRTFGILIILFILYSFISITEPKFCVNEELNSNCLPFFNLVSLQTLGTILLGVLSLSGICFLIFWLLGGTEK